MPLDRYPDTCSGQRLAYASFASQKNHMAVDLPGIYADDETRQAFAAAYRATGKRYDVGNSCVRFGKLDDLPLALIGESVARIGVDAFIAQVEKAHSVDALTSCQRWAACEPVFHRKRGLLSAANSGKPAVSIRHSMRKLSSASRGSPNPPANSKVLKQCTTLRSTRTAWTVGASFRP
jgi:hypothetical protein